MVSKVWQKNFFGKLLGKQEFCCSNCASNECDCRCAASLPGSFVLPRSIDDTSTQDTKLSFSVSDPSIAFDELLNTLAEIHKLSVSNVLFRIFSNTSFAAMRAVLDRLIVPKYGNDEIYRDRAHLKSACRLAVLLSIETVFLEHRTAPNEQRRAEIVRKLDDLQQRMIAHGVDRQGSIEKLWHIIMTKKSKAKVALEAREWQTVRLMNMAKQLRVDTINDIANLLWAYLRHGTREGRLESMYANVVQRIKGDLQML